VTGGSVAITEVLPDATASSYFASAFYLASNLVSRTFFEPSSRKKVAKIFDNEKLSECGILKRISKALSLAFS
jgi:hypothetical protein